MTWDLPGPCAILRVPTARVRCFSFIRSHCLVSYRGRGDSSTGRLNVGWPPSLPATTFTATVSRDFSPVRAVNRIDYGMRGLRTVWPLEHNGHVQLANHLTPGSCANRDAGVHWPCTSSVQARGARIQQTPHRGHGAPLASVQLVPRNLLRLRGQRGAPSPCIRITCCGPNPVRR